MAANRGPAKPNDAEADEGEMSEAEIDQNLVDTFPASDPPSWTLGIDHGQGSYDELQNKLNDVADDSEADKY